MKYTYRFLPASGHFSESLACMMEITSKARACPFSPWEQCFKKCPAHSWGVHAWETNGADWGPKRIMPWQNSLMVTSPSSESRKTSRPPANWLRSFCNLLCKLGKMKCWGMHVTTRTWHDIHRNMSSKVGAHPSTLTPSSRRSKSGSTSWTSAALVMFGSTSFYLFSFVFFFFFFHMAIWMLSGNSHGERFQTSMLQMILQNFFGFGCPEVSVVKLVHFVLLLLLVNPQIGLMPGADLRSSHCRPWTCTSILHSLHRNFDGGGIFVPIYPCDICYKLFLCHFCCLLVLLMSIVDVWSSPVVLDLSGVAATLLCCEISDVMLQQLAVMCSNDGMKAHGAWCSGGIPMWCM